MDLQHQQSQAYISMHNPHEPTSRKEFYQGINKPPRLEHAILAPSFIS